MTADRFYGFQEQALLCEHVISSLFSVSAASTSNHVGVGAHGLDTPPHSPILDPKDAPPPLGEFIAYALYRTRLPDSITHQALVLLSRLKARYPSARGTSTSPHRLFLSSLMLSSKISMDDTYSNKSWQVVGQGLFALREVNQMERELFAFLGWNVVVRDEELAAFVRDVVLPSHQILGFSTPVMMFPKTAPIAAAVDDRKRRRASSEHLPPPAQSSSPRSRSPDDSRHRRASDAAIAILQGGHHASESSTSTSSTSQVHSSRRSHSRQRDHHRPSPYSTGVLQQSTITRSGSAASCSASSSSFSSPISAGSATPGSPSTPISAGPMTPDHQEHQLPPPAWANGYPTPASSHKVKMTAIPHDHPSSSSASHHSHHGGVHRSHHCSHPVPTSDDGHVQVATW